MAFLLLRMIRVLVSHFIQVKSIMDWTGKEARTPKMPAVMHDLASFLHGYQLLLIVSPKQNT